LDLENDRRRARRKWLGLAAGRISSKVLRGSKTTRRLFTGLAAVSLLTGTLVITSNVVASPSNFVDITNHAVRYSGTGSYDWANSGTTGGTACTGATEIHVPGTNGLFDCGIFNGTTTPPTPPNFVGGSDVSAQTFVADPLSVDTSKCPFPPTGGTVPATESGDPTTYTGAGSETNGDLLSNDTWGSTSVPNKDEIANVYAVGHRVESGAVVTTNEIFFGAERVVNNGDSHIDFEFLQSAVAATLVPDATGCAGKFQGDRAQGDMLLSVDFLSGGTLGSSQLYIWDCNADPNITKANPTPTPNPQPAVGFVCNPPSHGQSVPHYFPISSSAVNFGVNDAGPVPCGGWACRNADGTRNLNIATNELMEGGIDLKSLNFTGCISTFLPHTRSSASFTAVLKDFSVHTFNTCRPATTLTTVSQTPNPIHVGQSATIVVKEANTGNVTITGVNVTGTGCTTWTAATNLNAPDAATLFTGSLGAGQSVNFTCTFSPTTTTGWTALGHGTFNGTAVPADNETQSGSVTVIHPATTLTKVSAPTTVHAGDSVTIVVKEANTGDDTLSAVTVSGTGSCASYTAASNLNPPDDATAFTGTLAGGQSVNFSCTFTAGSSTINWSATGHGIDSTGTAVPSTGETVSGQILIVIPNTALTKNALAVVNITYTYTEANTGNGPLTNITVTDDKCSSVVGRLKADNVHNIGDANNDLKLDTTETWTFTCTKTAALTVDTDATTLTIPGTDSVQNTGTGSGVDSLGSTVTFCATTPGPANTICSTTEQDTTTVSVTAAKP